MEKMDIEHFKAIIETKEAISWILERQAELRSELMAFYKKDLKEVQSSLNSIGSDKIDDFSKKALESLEKHFIDQWQRSYNLITPSQLNQE